MCAPSNAAVDEIVSRLLSVGVWNAEGQLVKPRLVRMGLSVSADPAVAAATLDAQERVPVLACCESMPSCNSITVPATSTPHRMLLGDSCCRQNGRTHTHM